MVGVDAERAETYLRLLAEAEVSLAVGAGPAAVGKPDVVHAGIWRMVVPAWVLVAVGAVRADAAETILADLQLALQARCLPREYAASRPARLPRPARFPLPARFPPRLTPEPGHAGGAGAGAGGAGAGAGAGAVVPGQGPGRSRVRWSRVRWSRWDAGSGSPTRARTSRCASWPPP